MAKPKLITTIDFLRNNIRSSATALNLEVCADMIENYLTKRYFEHGNKSLNEQIADVANDLNKEIADRIHLIQYNYQNKAATADIYDCSDAD